MKMASNVRCDDFQGDFLHPWRVEWQSYQLKEFKERTLSYARLSAGAIFIALVPSCSSSTTSTAGRSSDIDIQASAPGKAECVATTSAQQQAGVAATNAVRERSGLPAVTANATLAKAAAQHACDMARRGRMTHAGSSTSGPSQRVKSLGYAPSVTAENIAAGPFGLDRVLGEWDASPGHTANMLIPQVRQFGIGQAVGSDGRTRYWAAVYAAPKGR